jgi:branched-subunit amino acid transport protein
MDFTHTFFLFIALGLVTAITRCFFFLSERELTLPPWAQRGLRYAPLAALAAVIAPEIVLTQGAWPTTWHDARWFAVLAASAWFAWRRSVFGTIIVGMAVLIPLRLGLGW